MRVKNYVASETELNNELDRLYRESKAGKSFTGILELASNEQTIVTAIHNMKSNKGSKTAGIDKKVINNYLQMPYRQLIGLVKSAFANYNPKPVKRHYIAKRNSNKLRPLGIPVIIDRIVEECLRIVLEPICEAKFFPYSFGFRPYRATKDAVKNLCSTITKHHWVIEGDCHHVRPWLPIEQINKVPQLAWLCIPCHAYVHNTNLPNVKATVKKILKYRDLLIDPSK